MIGYVILALIASLSIAILRHFSREIRNRRLARTSRRRLPYRCVAIRFDEGNCCRAVRAFADTRFLARLAPLFPLAECGRLDCQCWYEHFDDRRQDDRRDHYSRMTRNYGGPEKRIRNGDRRQHMNV
ncbi:MAG: conserved hypothetical rane protein [Proteobacteria bacterium]|nr:conserved hypothetical rane protein [Pseudomonadota bacterium]